MKNCRFDLLLDGFIGYVASLRRRAALRTIITLAGPVSYKLCMDKMGYGQEKEETQKTWPWHAADEQENLGNFKLREELALSKNSLGRFEV